MALKDLLALVDDKLESVFNKQPVDPARARKPFLKGITKCRTQFTEGKQPRGDKKWWSANNNVVAFTPNVDGNPVKIGGKDRLYIPSERFPDFLTGLEGSVNAGELDDQLVTEGGATGVGNGRATGQKRTSSLAGRAWSPERRAAHERAKAAKKAAK